MRTLHKTVYQDARELAAIPTDSIDLVVTSPPYPMISMWDDVFGQLNPAISRSLETNDGYGAFNLMHEILDDVWDELFRVLKTGGFACINIGDATRTLDGRFGLYPNHSRILNHLMAIGFSVLPEILWRKQTNSPNKFMGSGMLPAGAYVTLEHEYILIVRKGSKRVFQTDEEKQNRYESALFWEERNLWYSDIWVDIKGDRQNLNSRLVRDRSAAFPFELAYRLINMYSVKNDVILDPFLGTGTSMAAAIASGRNTIGVEIDSGFRNAILGRIEQVNIANESIDRRLQRHLAFVDDCAQANKALKYVNKNYDFPVKTSQEVHILFNSLKRVKKLASGEIEVTYSPIRELKVKDKVDLYQGQFDYAHSN